MPVKSFVAAFVYEDWDTERRDWRTEAIKARHLEEAKEKARQMSVEMGPDWELLDVLPRSRGNLKYLKGRYDTKLRSNARGAVGRHLFPTKGRKRRSSRHHSPIQFPSSPKMVSSGVGEKTKDVGCPESENQVKYPEWETTAKFPSIIRRPEELVPGEVLWHVYGHLSSAPTRRRIDALDLDGKYSKVEYTALDCDPPYQDCSHLPDQGIGACYNNNRFFKEEEDALRYLEVCRQRGIR